MIEISVTSDVEEMRKDLYRIRSKVPSITAQSVNALATWARRETITETARDLQVPEARISRYIVRDKSGGKKTAPRFILHRANPFIPVARLDVKGKAIELTDVPYSWNRSAGGGVSGPGGRFYRGAFVAKIAGKKRVLKRAGKARLPLKSIYLGTRTSMADTFRSHIAGAPGVAYFRNKFRELAGKAILKAGG